MKLNLTILETSDIHGSIMPLGYGNNKYEPLGLAKVSTIIKEERTKEQHVLVIDNGDLIQGTPLTYHYVKKQSYEENPMIRVLNHLNYDAAVVGNHEFNYGMDVLKQAVKHSSFPWLSANILEEQSGNPFLGKPYIIKQYDSAKVAVLGVTTHYVPNWENPAHIEGLTFENVLQSTQKWVSFIKEKEKPDLLIVSYHGGFEKDPTTGEITENLTGENQGYEICQKIAGIDILLTGHQHRTIATYINNVLVLQPGVNGQMVGKATIVFEKEAGMWKIVDKKAELKSVEQVEADQYVIELIQDYETATQKWLDIPMGKIKGDMMVEDAHQLRLGDNALIEFINKVQMKVSGAEISNSALFHINSPGFPANVTMRDIVSNYIYPNTLKVIQLTGQDIKDALERSASYFMIGKGGEVVVNPSFITPKPQHYNYDMWEGIEYILDIRRPIGERVVKLTRNGQEMDLDQKFEVVMNNYRAGGGGDYAMYRDKPVVKDIPMDMSELIANYILEEKVINASVNRNWKVIWKEDDEGDK
ncbi:MAG: bifunctional UDP-sugar hydrolase/5'-nucleotidase [Bacillota bacterium]|nr:bifunctional UDP-sugar hydrolase/5'-nucleotidase [Bacillota bacterium]